MKTLRTIARVMSAIIVSFALIMFIGYIFEGAQKANPKLPSTDAIVGLTLFGIGLLGLALAWKWEIAGGIISLLAVITIFIRNPDAMVWTMFIFPANAILFVVVGYNSKKSEKHLVN
jgi:hypothetical protein